MEEKKRPRRKPGKTILVSSDWKNEINVEGVESTHQTDNGARFVVFDTLENARSAFKSLRESGARVKYSYYKSFFRLSNVDLTNSSYDDLKEKVKSVTTKLGANNILYFKFYTKNGNIIGSGDLTVDTKAALDSLVSSNDNEFGEGSISFYRFKVKRNENDDDSSNKAVSVV